MRGSMARTVSTHSIPILVACSADKNGSKPMHAHLEGQRTRGHFAADPTQADDAQRLVGQLGPHVLVAVPLAFHQTLMRRGDIARQREHQGERVLGRAERVARRRVHHHDAQPRGCLLVDVVGAHAGADDRLQPPVTLERLRRDLDAAAADRTVVLAQRLPQIVPLQSGPHVEFDLRRPA